MMMITRDKHGWMRWTTPDNDDGGQLEMMIIMFFKKPLKKPLSGVVWIRPCVPIGSGVAYRDSPETLDYRTMDISSPDYFSESNKRAMDDANQMAMDDGVLFWSTGGVTHTCAFSRVFSKAPPPFIFCSSDAGSKHYDCAALNWLDVYKAYKDHGYYSEGGYGLIPVQAWYMFNSPTGTFAFIQGSNYALNDSRAYRDSWGLQDGQWLREFIRDDIGSFDPDEFMDKGVTVNGARATSSLE